jgi:hypothetical protein
VDLAERTHGAVGDSLGRVVHRQAPTDADGTVSLAEDTQPQLKTLRRERSPAACDHSGTDEQCRGDIAFD